MLQTDQYNNGFDTRNLNRGIGSLLTPVLTLWSGSNIARHVWRWAIVPSDLVQSFSASCAHYHYRVIHRTITNMWANPTKSRTNCKTCFWVNSHNRWLAQNYFQIFKFVFSCLLSGEQCILSNVWKNLFKWDFFQTINDGLSLLIRIHSCSKWKTNWPISK